MTIRYISPKDTDIAADAALVSVRITNKRLTSEEKIPPDLERLAPYFLEHLRDNPQKTTIREEVLPKLERLIEKHPTNPILYNYLSAAFEHLGEKDKLDALVEEQYHQSPHYLFARINYAHYLLDQGRITEIPDVLVHTFTLHEAFPEKKEFHVSEAISFTTFMGLYQHLLGHSASSKAWMELAKKIDSEHIHIRKITSRIKKITPHFDGSQKEHEHFPPSMNLIFVTPEQELIDFLEPFLPIPCTIVPRTVEHFRKQGFLVSPKTQVSISKVFDSGHEGGVICDIGLHNKEGQDHALLISITHLIIKPKHKTEIRVQAYQRKRVAQLEREGREAMQRKLPILPKI